jgi:hypothetical protein
VLRKLQANPTYADLARDFVPVQIRITFANGTRLHTTELGAAGGAYLVAVRALYSLVQKSCSIDYDTFFDRCLEGLPRLRLADVIAAVAAKCHEQPTTRLRPIFLSIIIDEAHELTVNGPHMSDFPQ